MAGKRIVVPILGEHFPSFSKVRSVQELINFYLEEDKAQERFLAFGTPGFEEWANLNGGQGRAMLEHNGIGYFVMDDGFYKIVDKNTISLLGNLSTNLEHVSVAAIKDQICIADGTSLYNYIISSDTFTTVGDVDAPTNPTVVTSISEYFVVPTPSDNTFFVSDISDGTSWNALSFASADEVPDNIVSMLSVNTLLWAFCESSCEVFYVSGGATVPVDRRVAGNYQFGTGAKHSPKSLDNVTYWLAQNKNGIVGVVRSNGSLPQIISNRAMIQKIHTYDTISDAFGWTYQENGHPFYLITFPTAELIDGVPKGVTWGFDVSTEVWTEWSSAMLNAIMIPEQTRYLTNCHMYLNGEHLVGSHIDGKIYKMDPSITSENGEEIRRKIRTNHYANKGLKISMHNLVVETESGSGLPGTGQGSDPEIMLRYSKNHGRTWSNELVRKTGKLGDYEQEAIWNRIGSGPAITLELTMTDPIKWVILGATALVEVENG